jgi:ABC-type Zn uptake system ZnuABC Zn-binding protein ZnuA
MQKNLLILGMLILGLAACAPQPQATSPDGRLRVVATTSIVGDVVSQIGGERIDLKVLLPLSADPHSYAPTPREIAGLTQADLVFVNGAGLEEFLAPLLEDPALQGKIVSVSEGIELLALQEAAHPEEEAEHGHEGGDPHTWTDPNNVIVWTENIARALAQADPEGQAVYQANRQAYQARLGELDGWVRQQIASIPAENREIVTDHLVYGYFARRYGFTQVGAVIPGFSTLAEPSAQELAALVNSLRDLKVKAIFVGRTVNPNLAQQIAADTGVKLVSLYDGALSEPGGEADSYLAYIRYNVSAMAAALR